MAEFNNLSLDQKERYVYRYQVNQLSSEINNILQKELKLNKDEIREIRYRINDSFLYKKNVPYNKVRSLAYAKIIFADALTNYGMINYAQLLKMIIAVYNSNKFQVKTNIDFMNCTSKAIKMLDKTYKKKEDLIILPTKRDIARENNSLSMTNYKIAKSDCNLTEDAIFKIARRVMKKNNMQDDYITQCNNETIIMEQNKNIEMAMKNDPNYTIYYERDYDNQAIEEDDIDYELLCEEEKKYNEAKEQEQKRLNDPNYTIYDDRA